MTALHAAGLARRFRTHAKAARLAGDFDRAACLYRMAVTVQAQAVTPCF